MLLAVARAHTQLAPVAERAGAKRCELTGELVPARALVPLGAVASAAESVTQVGGRAAMDVRILAVSRNAQTALEEAAYGHALGGRLMRKRASRRRPASPVQKWLAYGNTQRVVLIRALGALARTVAIPAKVSAQDSSLGRSRLVGAPLPLKVDRGPRRTSAAAQSAGCAAAVGAPSLQAHAIGSRLKGSTGYGDVPLRCWLWCWLRRWWG